MDIYRDFCVKLSSRELLKMLLTDNSTTPIPVDPYQINMSKTTSSSPETVTLDRIQSSVPFDVDWGDGNIETISANNTSPVTHEYATADTYEISFSVEFMTYISFPSRGLSGDLSGLSFASNLERVYIYGNNFTGDLSGWVLPDTLRYLYIYSNNFTGDLSSWVMPSAMQNLFIYSNNFTGSLDSWVLLGSLGRFRLSSNNFSGSPDYSNATVLNEIELQDNNMSQEDVDSNLLGIYTNRAIFTNSTPTLEIQGSNASPSGTYQDADPPTTGKEYAYYIENDPDVEGFNTWSVTYTT